MTTYGFVFARGGSKGIPGKNVRELAGKPLLAHALFVANSITEISSCFVSTDNAEIASIARADGAIVIDRPPELAQDTSAEWTAWQHAVEWVQAHYGPFGRFVSLPATAPLRSPRDVEACLNALDDETDIVVSVTESSRNPWFNMVRENEKGKLELLAQTSSYYARRQDAPKIYEMTTLAYVSRPDFILENRSMWDGRVRGVVIPAERAIDIDTPLDFEIADLLMRERRKKNQGIC